MYCVDGEYRRHGRRFELEIAKRIWKSWCRTKNTISQVCVDLNMAGATNIMLLLLNEVFESDDLKGFVTSLLSEIDVAWVMYE